MHQVDLDYYKISLYGFRIKNIENQYFFKFQTPKTVRLFLFHWNVENIVLNESISLIVIGFSSRKVIKYKVFSDEELIEKKKYFIQKKNDNHMYKGFHVKIIIGL